MAKAARARSWSPGRCTPPACAATGRLWKSIAPPFPRADMGTLFLDEVGDMSLKTQSKVLRVLEEQRFEPVGSNQAVDVDVRVIAATNKTLEGEIARGAFRQDLFYRLNVIPFHVSPLRERIEDLLILA